MGSPLTKLLSRTFNRVSPSGEPAPKNVEAYRAALNEILKEREGKIKGIIVYPPTVDWNIPLFQRPQQLALELSKSGYLFFFSTGKNLYDRVDGFRKINDNCYVTNQYDLVIKELPKFILLLSSTNLGVLLEDVARMKGKATVVYDYIDEIHRDISKENVDHAFKRHEYMKRHADVFIATADNLYNEALKDRPKDTYLIPNGVDYDHFHVQRNPANVPLDLAPILEKKKPVIGYYGALASWFDYELIKKAAETRTDLEFVLIGWDYDGSLYKQGLDQYRNIHYLGIKDYSILPQYAVWFDVATIPFVLNKITESTSPIKVFEYMALGTPIVTTNLRECRKYRSVLIGKDQGDFLRQLDEALRLRDDTGYKALLDKEAKENTWDKRAAEIVERITGKH
ncbi:conserved hypothetical protein [Methanocella paludicola SANAE]|uniref:Glycosyltransferase n=2 Tax=Methanocella TaxID=570266 RepID=D1YV36_METPS|nr:conserved hypothetical protein [Methanocella paludicola SANAE]